MECQAPGHKIRRPQPKRGQVKTRIFRGLFRAVAPRLSLISFSNRDGGGDGSSSADATPAASGYTSSCDDG
ncbi:hypothetical protein Cni_G13377 [Canna indica]|uniref:Uncharacterized protein n=1 Tax=Canna indica TaxID=4628 RepID=A0AAQ3KBQ6_9LILI|nr:hypothetical protein Cni_G13377 [Canna indica]